MFTKKFDIGFSSVIVTRNGKQVNFEVNVRKAVAFWLEDTGPIYAEGCYEIIVNLLSYKVGDIIKIEFDKGEFGYDGGGERMDNVVGYIGEYTVGMGCPATYDYEDDYWPKEVWPKDLNHTNRVLPYDNSGRTNHGFEFEVMDDPTQYYDKNWRWNIKAVIAWEKSDKEYAWEKVSCLTS